MFDFQITAHHTLSEASCCYIHSVFPQFYGPPEQRVDINSLPTTRLDSSFRLDIFFLFPTKHARSRRRRDIAQRELSAAHPLADFPHNSCLNSHTIPPTLDQLACLVSPRSSAARFCSLAKLNHPTSRNRQFFHSQSPPLLSSDQRDARRRGGPRTTQYGLGVRRTRVFMPQYHLSGISGNGITSCVYRSSEGLDATAQSSSLID